MQKPEVVAVYLFGSYAKGDEHRTSDIDIGILIKENLRTGASEKKIGYMVELSKYGTFRIYQQGHGGLKVGR